MSGPDPGRPRYGCLYKHLLEQACALPGACGLVFACLVAHADPDGSSCFPSRATIARTIRRKVTVVAVALRLLREAGMIEQVDFMPRGVVVWLIPGMRIAAQVDGQPPMCAENGKPDRRFLAGQVAGYPHTTRSLPDQRQSEQDQAAPLPGKERPAAARPEAPAAPAGERKSPPAPPSRWGNHMKKLPPVDPATLPEPGSYPDCRQAEAR